MTDLFAAALAWHDAGYNVLPTRSDGSKAPACKWQDYQRERYPRERLITTVRDGFGLLPGDISGGLEMVEFEGLAIAEGRFEVFEAMVAMAGLGELWARVWSGPNAYAEATPSGGIHILYRLADAPVSGNTRLAARPARLDELDEGEREVLTRKPDKVFPRLYAETRGEGGFTVTAPSGGRTHPTGQPWRVLTGGAGVVPTITFDERMRLHTLFRGLHQMPAKPTPRTSASVSTPAASNGRRPVDLSSGDDFNRPGKDFNQRATWAEVLEPHGWRWHNNVDGVDQWTRPGKDTGVSATTNALGTDMLHVFSSSTEFEAEANRDKFGVARE